jgi:hypothetical protein
MMSNMRNERAYGFPCEAAITDRQKGEFETAMEVRARRISL